MDSIILINITVGGFKYMRDIKRLVIEIDQRIHTKIKRDSAQEGITIKEYVTKALAHYMSFKEDLKDGKIIND